MESSFLPKGRVKFSLIPLDFSTLKSLEPNSLEKNWLEFWLQQLLEFRLEIPYIYQKQVVKTCLRIQMESQSVFQAETQVEIFLLKRLPERY